MSGGVKRYSDRRHCGQTKAKTGNIKEISRSCLKWATLLTSLAKLVAAIGNLTRIIMDTVASHLH